MNSFPPDERGRFWTKYLPLSFWREDGKTNSSLWWAMQVLTLGLCFENFDESLEGEGLRNVFENVESSLARILSIIILIILSFNNSRPDYEALEIF